MWAYLVLGALGIWLAAAVLILLMWLRDKHEDTFVAVVIAAAITVFGLGLGYAAYRDALRSVPKPPAEVTK